MIVDLDHHTQQLQEVFGLPSFRPWQMDAIKALLEDALPVLVVAPTGGGKSLTYQYPATQLEGTTVVVSPLIALMEDQVRGLTERGISATFLASTLSREEVSKREQALRRGRYKLLYVAPERLGSDWLMNLLRDLNPPLVAIDEAHCISQWGHDFRPDYLRLGDVIRRLRPKRVLACTATATPRVRAEIIKRLDLGPGKVILRGFARPNLHLKAELLDSPKRRRARLMGALDTALGDPKNPKGAAIVYAATRKGTEGFTEHIRAGGFRCAAYHAGLPATERARVNAEFATGGLDVVVATNAFGMGIDRADIRLVAHVQAPGSVEAYYQEVGRAGRDGKPAVGLLMSASSDLGLRRRLIERPWEGGVRSQERIGQQWSMFLDLMRYVEAGSCRHDHILRYFGDEAELLGGCGHCDICEELGDADPQAQVLSDEDVITIRKALAGVARARGRVGMRVVAEMLAGKANTKIRRWGFDRLSTFGLFRSQGVDWALALLRRLITAGYAAVDAGQYPLLVITRRGAEIMKGESPPRMLLPPVGAGSPKKSQPSRQSPKTGLPELSGEDSVLYEALRECRMKLAAEKNVPAYVVCSNRTLSDLALKKPTTDTELLDVFGMGPARVESWGAPLLDVVRDYIGVA